MKLKLKKKKNNYAQVHTNMLRNQILSLKSKGLGSLLESYSDDFYISTKSLELNNLDGIKSIRSAIKELEQANHLFRYQFKNKFGLFETVWIFDSLKLDVNYINDALQEHKKITLLTKNKFVEILLSHNSIPVTDSPSGTTYNNNNCNSDIFVEKYFFLEHGRLVSARKFIETVKVK